MDHMKLQESYSFNVPYFLQNVLCKAVMSFPIQPCWSSVVSCDENLMSHDAAFMQNSIFSCKNCFHHLFFKLFLYAAAHISKSFRWKPSWRSAFMIMSIKHGYYSIRLMSWRKLCSVLFRESRSWREKTLCWRMRKKRWTRRSFANRRAPGVSFTRHCTCISEHTPRRLSIVWSWSKVKRKTAPRAGLVSFPHIRGASVQKQDEREAALSFREGMQNTFFPAL